MMLVLLVIAGTVVWIMWKRNRANVLAGRNSAKPVYHSEPPTRRLHSPRRDVL